MEASFATLFTLMCLFTIGTVIYWLFIQNPEIIYNMDPNVVVFSPRGDLIGINDVSIKAGDTIIITRNYCQLPTNRPGTIHRFYVNHVIYDTITSLTSNEFAGCRERKFTIDIPGNLPTDTYRYQATITFKINMLVTKEIKLPPLTLRLVNPTQQAVQELLRK